MQEEKSPSNKKLSVLRSSSTSVLPDFTQVDMQENSNNTINQQIQSVDDFSSSIKYSKYIITPEQALPDKKLSKGNVKKKVKYIPLSKAKDQIMQLMKLSNDEYIAQVDNMKRSEDSLKTISSTIRAMEPVKFNIIHHPIYFEIAMNNYTIDYCNEEINRIKLNIDSYGILYNEIEKVLGLEAPQISSQPGSDESSSNSILINENSQHRSSVDDTSPKARFRPFGPSSLARRRTTAAKRTSLTLESSPIVQTAEQQQEDSEQQQQVSEQQQDNKDQKMISKNQQKTSNQEQKQKETTLQQLQKKHKKKKRTQTPPQQMKSSDQILSSEIDIQNTNEKLVDISSFTSDCLKIRSKPNLFIQRRSLLHRLYLPFPIERSIEFIDPNKPSESQDDIEKSVQNVNTAGKNPLFKKLNEEANNAFIINPNDDKVGYLLNPKSKSGRILQRFILKSSEMQFEDIEVIADALFDLASDYLTKDEIVGILFDLMWTTNPSKYPIVPRINTFWVPYVMDLIPAAVDPPYLSEKWKRKTFHELSNTKDWPLREAVDSLFDLYLHSNPFEIGRCFSKTINLVAVAVQDMVEVEGGKREDVEIDFDQLFNLLIVCIFASGLPTITGPLSYASYFDQYACYNNEIHFAMSHMEGLCAHLPKMNFKELREKSNKLKEQYQKEEELEKMKENEK